MANEQFYKEAHRRLDYPEIRAVPTRPEDWTSNELEQQASAVYEFAHLINSRTNKPIRITVPPERIKDLQRIGRIARRTAKERLEQFMGK